MAVERAVSRSFGLPRVSLGAVTFATLNLVGMAAYLYPFMVARAVRPESDWFAHNTDGPLIVAVVAALCLILVVSELTEGSLNSKSLAAIGVLAAMAAAMRTITLVAGANPYFFLVILAGYAFGPRIGFLVGALSFFLSAIITAGVGPWLPFQAFASAWMGLTAGLLRPASERAGLGIRGQVAVLAAFGFAWGFAFGAITNLWAWPFFVSGPDISYEPGLGVAETLRRYWNFYLLTSLGWDLLRAVANAVVLAAVGAPLLRALLRYRDRVTWQKAP